MKKNNLSIGCYVVSANYGKFLGKCLDSLLTQNTLPDTLKLVNVCSVDETSSVYDEYYLRFMRLGVNCEIVNLPALNLLEVIDEVTPLMTNDYVFRLDADDFLESNFINAVKEFIQNKDGCIDLLYSGYNKTDEVGNVISYEPASALECYSTPSHGACTLLSQRLLNKIGKFTNFGTNGQDGLIAWAICNQNKFVASYIEKALFNYRQHQVSLTSGVKKFAEKRCAVLSRVIDYRKNKKTLFHVFSVNENISKNDFKRELLGKMESEEFFANEEIFSTFQEVKIIVFCSQQHAEIGEILKADFKGRDLRYQNNLEFLVKEQSFADHFNEFLCSSFFREFLSAEIVTSNFLIEDFSKARVSEVFYRLINLYFAPHFTIKFMATGNYSHIPRVTCKSDFSYLNLGEDLRKISTRKTFGFKYGIFAISEGASMLKRQFIPVEIDDEEC